MKVLSWNIEGRLSSFSEGRGSPTHILSEIERHDADVVILPEASEGDEISVDINEAITSLGYATYTAYYQDKGTRQYAAEINPTIKILSRLPVSYTSRSRYGDIRNNLIVDVVDLKTQETIRIFGIHLDDRNEKNRIMQMEDIVHEIRTSPYPVVLAGDFNAMHAEDSKAKIVRAVLRPRLTRLAPAMLMMDIVGRVYEMASGSVLAMLEDKGNVRPADLRFHATATPKLRGQTWLPSVRMIQIDHIYVSADITLNGFEVAPDGGSDHRAISAIISL